MFALVDCNNFFVSCERIFNPKLERKPVIVLSNNDGCVIARSNEAKALGIRMAQPMFELTTLIKQHDVQWLSSNYTLYASMSQRMMQCIQAHCAEVDVYSIDEAFVCFAMHPDAAFTSAKKLREVITQWTGIPVSIGLGATNTLAKAANSIAKKTAAGVYLLNHEARETIFQQFPVGEVWGIGRSSNATLQDLGIRTIHDLLQRPRAWLRQQFSLSMEETVLELQGVSCIGLEELVSKKAIQSSRSFSRSITDLQELSSALSMYVATAAEKLRAQHGLAQSLCISVSTSRFKPGKDYYAKQKTIALSYPSQDTRALTGYALTLLKALYQPGFSYHKCGVVLLDIIPEQHRQMDLFGDVDHTEQASLMQVYDTINHKYGRSTIRLASEGFKKGWASRSHKRSPNYTTQWDNLAVVLA